MTFVSCKRNAARLGLRKWIAIIPEDDVTIALNCCSSRLVEFAIRAWDGWNSARTVLERTYLGPLIQLPNRSRTGVLPVIFVRSFRFRSPDR
jgi:hypothetical protein